MKSKLLGFVAFCIIATARSLSGAIFYAEASVHGQVGDTALGIVNQKFDFDTGLDSATDMIFADTSTIKNSLTASIGTGQGTASAGPGHIACSAFSQSNVFAPGSANVQVSSDASLYDDITLSTLGGAPGSIVQVMTHWNISGFIETHATTPNAFVSNASASGILTVWGTAFGADHGSETSSLLVADSGKTINAIQNIAYQNDAPAEIPVVLTLQVGYPFPLGATIKAQFASNVGTNAEISANSGGSADFAHTLGWGGIDSVTDADGNPITDWSITSSSGFDYSRPYTVPEPSALVLTFTLSLVLSSIRRRLND